jgi:hypothetical protein
VLNVKKQLAVLFNLSLLSGIFPCVWKEYVVPFFKENISNYIVEYPLYRRFLFEKLFCDVITSFIRPLISDGQHGFVCGRFTVTSLVEFSNFVLSELEDGLQADAVYTDFSKDFYGVNHGLLLGRLTRKFCGPMTFWMGFYLTGRTQRVRVGD